MPQVHFREDMGLQQAQLPVFCRKKHVMCQASWQQACTEHCETHRSVPSRSGWCTPSQALIANHAFSALAPSNPYLA